MLGYLRVTEGPDTGRIFNLEDGLSLSIGRSDKTDTKLKDLSVSRIHCELRVVDGQFLLVDNESVGGTFVNGQKIKEQTLKTGDTIKIGQTEMRIQAAGIPDADTLLAAQKTPRTLEADSGSLTGETISHFEVGPFLAKGKTGGGLVFASGIALSVFREKLLVLPDQIAHRKGVFSMLNWR